MNCKPGDLAVMISGRNCGTLVQVGEAFVTADSGRTMFAGFPFIGHGPAWVCRTVGRPMLAEYVGKEVQFYERPIADASLRPIRDPGDDAKDETLAWLTVPSRGQVERTKPDEKKVPA